VENSLNCSKNDKTDTPIYGGICFINPISARVLLGHKKQKQPPVRQGLFYLYFSTALFRAAWGKTGR
jgi:hypothetical protein